MPNRILRDWTDSYSIEPLSADAERLFVRLIMKADDFGRYHADPRLVKAGCFPLLNAVRDTDISRWLAECQKSGLIAIYQVNSRSYLTINNFGQRKRAEESKFPTPDNTVTDTRPPDDRQMTAQSEAETYSEAEACAHGDKGPPPLAHIPSESEFLDEFMSDGMPVGFLRKQWAWFEGNNGWLDRSGRLKKYAVTVRSRWVEDRQKWSARTNGDGVPVNAI